MARRAPAARAVRLRRGGVRGVRRGQRRQYRDRSVSMPPCELTDRRSRAPRARRPLRPSLLRPRVRGCVLGAPTPTSGDSTRCARTARTAASARRYCHARRRGLHRQVHVRALFTARADHAASSILSCSPTIGTTSFTSGVAHFERGGGSASPMHRSTSWPPSSSVSV